MVLQITEITSEPKQKHLLSIEGYEKATLYLEFKPNQNAWFFSIVWQDFSTYNIQLVKSYNILRQFKNIIPFGIGIYTKSGQDPMVDTAFSSGDTQFFLLNAEDVQSIETAQYG
jgi:hypothetical protein